MTQESTKALSVLESGLVPVYVNEAGERLVDARELYAFLEVGKDFSNWIKDRIKKYGFVENVDYITFAKNGETATGGYRSQEYILKMDVAKEIAMVQNNDKGREVRQYFISIERRFQEAVLDQLAMYQGMDADVLQLQHAADMAEADAKMTKNVIKVCQSYGIGKIESALMVHKAKSNGSNIGDLIGDHLKVIQDRELQKKRDRIYVRVQRLGTYLSVVNAGSEENPYEDAWHKLSDELIFEAGTKTSLRKKHEKDKLRVEEMNAGRKRGEPKEKCPGYLDYIHDGNLYKEAEKVADKLLRKYAKLAAKVEQENAAKAEQAPAEIA